MTNSSTAEILDATRKRSVTLATIWKLIFIGEPSETFVSREPLNDSDTSVKFDNQLACQVLKKGITSKALSPVGEFLGLSKSQIASYLELDRGTVTRLAAKNQLLPTHAAENVLRFLELDSLAAETFDSHADAFEWLKRPHPMLEGDSPLNAARTSYGTQRVKDILLSIKYGGVV